MDNVTITIQTRDNHIQAFGYDPKFYADVATRNTDIIKDLTRAKKVYGENIALVMVAEWSENEEPSGIVYGSIDEVIKAYNPKKAKKV
jgi:hypothetical protein